MGFNLMPNFFGSNTADESEHTTNNSTTAVQDRSANVGSGSVNVSANDGAQVIQTINTTDYGALSKATQLAEDAVISSALLGGTAINSGMDLASRALMTNRDISSQGLDLAGGIVAGVGDFLNSFTSAAFGSVNKAQASAQASTSAALNAIEKNAQRSTDSIAAAAQRATSAVGDAYTKSVDSATGNRSLWLAGIVVAGVALLVIYGRKG